MNMFFNLKAIIKDAILTINMLYDFIKGNYTEVPADTFDVFTDVTITKKSLILILLQNNSYNKLIIYLNPTRLTYK